MKDGDRADYEFLTAHEIEYAAKTGDRLLDALVQLDEGLSGYKITRLGHSLQAATRAWRDGADTDWIACALLHDIGDIYAPYNHDEYAAAILKPFVREQCTWVVEKHGDFQRLYYAHHLGGNRHARDRFAGHPYFDDCDQFCERWDQSSFDPDYETLPVEFFRPFVLEVFARKAYDPAVIRAGERVALDQSRNSKRKRRSIRMSIIKKAAAIGGGVIGAGWVARLVLNGIDVAIFDPDPEASRKVGEVMKGARRAYKLMLPKGLPKEGKITYVKTIAEAVSGADFIQESVPERLDLKHRVLAEIDLHAAKDALVGSSTSGIKPTDMQSAMKRPERLVVGHPFNPVYLLPLVEIVGGETTSKKFIERAREIYASIGMKPVVIRKEIEAFVGDRLLEAAWREALWLVKDGITTVEELDDIMRYSFGLRWAQMGMFQVYRIAGGEAGMRHFMAQFGPALKWPWTKLMDVPEFNDELVDLIATQSDEQAHGLSIRAAGTHPRRQSGGDHGCAVEAEQGQGLGRRRAAQRLHEATRQARREEAEGGEGRRKPQEGQGGEAGEEIQGGEAEEEIGQEEGLSDGFRPFRRAAADRRDDARIRRERALPA